MASNWKWIPFDSADEIDIMLSDGGRSGSVTDKSGTRTQSSIKAPVGEFKVKRAKQHLERLKSFVDKGVMKKAEVKDKIELLEGFLANVNP